MASGPAACVTTPRYSDNEDIGFVPLIWIYPRYLDNTSAIVIRIQGRRCEAEQTRIYGEVACALAIPAAPILSSILTWTSVRDTQRGIPASSSCVIERKRKRSAADYRPILECQPRSNYLPIQRSLFALHRLISPSVSVRVPDPMGHRGYRVAKVEQFSLPIYTQRNRPSRRGG